MEREIPLKIKVCGMRDPSNVEAVCRTGPDLLGFIFFRGSVRYVGDHPDPAVFKIPSPGIRKVGVFVNETAGRVRKIHENFGLDLVQLHGNESPEYCSQLMNEGIEVIKAFRPDVLDRPDLMGNYRDSAALFIFDSPGKKHGGTGRKFDWNLLPGKSIPVPFLLGGGVGPEDGDAIRELEHGSLYGIDINSRFEKAPGIKDPELLRRFMGSIRKALYNN